MFSSFSSYNDFIKQCQDFLLPESVYYCDGSTREYNHLCLELESSGKAKKLKGHKRYYFYSDPSDVARVESSTFICSKSKDDAGITNNWVDPDQMTNTLKPLFNGCMKGRVMYVIFYAMGPVDSPYSKLGIQVTDSMYVVIHMHKMTRMGERILERFKKGQEFSVGVHTVGCPLESGKKDPLWPCNDKKYIVHMPEKNSVYSFGSGYGGNALLAKKCFALRLASSQARKEGWLAEHMLIISVTNPKGIKRYFAAAFPSACGKTNLAMMQSKLEGYEVACVGDDIAWMHIGKDGHLYAINPENGFFGVAPGTSDITNPNAMKTIASDTLFTNVALTDDGDVWWEGMDKEKPKKIRNWKQQRPGENSKEPLSHPNARFATSISNCPILDANFNDAQGVRIDGIIFGGRNSKKMPLVLESFDYDHGVFLGASLSSEKTAASEGSIGQLRHDPFAMLAFCGYNMADYFKHWLSFEKFKMPRMFHVNWFRKSDDGQFLWPGYGENMRALQWMFERIEGQCPNAQKTVLGLIPKIEDFNAKGLDVQTSVLEKLLEVNPSDYKGYVSDLKTFYEKFGSQLDPRLQKQLNLLEGRVYEGCCTKS